MKMPKFFEIMFRALTHLLKVDYMILLAKNFIRIVFQENLPQAPPSDGKRKRRHHRRQDLTKHGAYGMMNVPAGPAGQKCALLHKAVGPPL